MKKLLSFLSMFFMVFATNAQVCPDDNHPHAIDLGLFSGTKWACCNVGANTPEGYGVSYAWGETEEKTIYDWTTYTHCDGTESTYHDIGRDITGSQYDAAHMKWGDSWQMPTIEQVRELMNRCTFEWTTKNGVNGQILTGPNGGTIFLPAGGFRWFDSLINDGKMGEYWSSTLSLHDDPESACGMCFEEGSRNWFEGGRECGRSVRPVISVTNSIVSISSEKSDGADTWHTIDGRTLNSKPTVKGIYINNGKKVVIK